MDGYWVSLASSIIDKLLQYTIRKNIKIVVGTLSKILVPLKCKIIAKKTFKKSLCAYKYSQPCIKRLPFGQRKSGLLRQVTS